MANRYWVGGTASWDATVGTKWALTSGGAGGQTVPTAADDVFMDATSGAVTVTTTTGIACRSLDFTGFTGTFSHAAATTLNIGDATAGSGNVMLKMVAGMTYTRGSATTSALVLKSSSATAQTITLAGKSLGAVTFQSGGNFSLSDAFNSNSIDFQAGTLSTNNNSVTVTSTSITACVTISTTGTKVINLGSSTLTVSGSWLDTATNTTLNAGTSTITMAPGLNNTDFTGNGRTYYNVTYSPVSSNQLQISGANTFNNLTFTGGTSQLHGAAFAANQTINGTLTLTGNSLTNRLTINTDGKGTQRTLTAAAVSLTNVNLDDIVGAGTASWTGTSVGGFNTSGITLATPVTRYWVGNGGNWSDTAHWSATSGGSSGATVPLAQDSVIFNASSISSAAQTITVDMFRVGSNVNFTGMTNNPELAFGTISSYYFYNNLTLISGMTISTSTSSFILRANANSTLTTGGNASIVRDIFIYGVTFTYTLVGALNIASPYGLTVASGTFDANNNNLTLNYLTSDISIAVPLARTIVMGSGTWTITGTGIAWDTGNTNGGWTTITPQTSTIVINNATATAKTLDMGTRTFNILTISGDNVTIQGNNTFDTLNVNTAGLTNGLKFLSGTTQTVNTFTTNGAIASLAKISASTPTSAFNLSKASGIVSEDYMSIQDSTATGGALWYAGTTSTNVSNNTGWSFANAPSDITKSTQYVVTSTVDITKTAAYAVTFNTNITKTAAYIVNLGADITKTAQYKVITTIDTTKTAQYLVANTSAMRNLVKNPDYERSTLGGDMGGFYDGVLTKDTTVYYAGSASLKVTSPNTAHTNGFIHSTGVAVAQDTIIKRTECKLLVPVGVTLEVRPRAESSPNQSMSGMSQFITGDGQWHHIVFGDWTYNLSSSFVPCIEAVISPALSGVSFWVDQVLITTDAGVTSYFSGNSTNGAWTGATDYSISYQTHLEIPAEYVVAPSESLDSSRLKKLKIGKKYGPVTSVILGRVPQNDNVVVSRVSPQASTVTSIDTSTNLFTIPANAMVNGNLVRIESTGTLPAPLIAETNYYVYTNGNANTFALSGGYEPSLVGANIINITSVGTGKITLTHLETQEVQINNNQIVDDDRQTLLPPIYTDLVGLEWNEVKAETIGLGWHEVGDVVLFSQQATLTSNFIDSFDRTVASGWGTPPRGGLWTLSGGTAADYFVDGDAKITPSAIATAYFNLLDNTVSAVSSELSFYLTNVPVGSSNSFSLETNYQDAQNRARFRITVSTSLSVTAAITILVANVETVLATVVVGTGYAAGDKWHINGTFDGVSLYTMYAWKDGNARPTTPDLTATDSTFTSGKIGIRAYESAGATNVQTFVMSEFISDFLQSYSGTKITKGFLSEASLTLAGSVKETLTSVIPDIATINYQTAGGVLKTLYNTEIKVDKQENDITSVVSQQVVYEDQTQTNFTELYQNITDILLTIQQSGGGNILLNSVGFAKTSTPDNSAINYDKLEFWDYNPSYTIATHGSIIAYDSSESQNNGGVSGEVVQMSGASVYIKQRVTVAVNSSLSFGIRVKNLISSGSALITISNDNESRTISVSSAQAYDWEELKTEDFVSTLAWLDIKIQVTSATSFIFTDLRLLYGNTLQTWVQSPAEILSTNVQFTKNGMRIFDNVHDTETQVTYNEFSTRRKADNVVLFEADDSGVATRDLTINGQTNYYDAGVGVIKQITIPKSSALAGIAFIGVS